MSTESTDKKTTKFTMRMAKATQGDMDSVAKLIQFLQAIEQGSFPPENEGDDWPDFDQFNHEDLIKFHEGVMEAFNQGSAWRVLMAAEAVLNPKNSLLDPDVDYLAFHPRLERMDQERKELLNVVKLAMPVVAAHAKQALGEGNMLYAAMDELVKRVES